MLDYVGGMEHEAFDMKAWRDARGLSQGELAAALKVSRWTVQRMERAKAAPHVFVLACKALEDER